MIRLVGVVLVVAGFLLGVDTIAVVLGAGLVTGLLAGLGLEETLATLGRAFLDARFISLFLLSLPAIGLLERYGLRERAGAWMARLGGVTSGTVLGFYALVRGLAAALSLRLGGHVQFIRPLIYPMALGAAQKRHETLEPAEVERLKGLAAAVENYGNFFGQNLFVASAGVLLVVATLAERNILTTPLAVARAALPIALLAGALAVAQCLLLDRRMRRRHPGGDA